MVHGMAVATEVEHGGMNVIRVPSSIILASIRHSVDPDQTKSAPLSIVVAQASGSRQARRVRRRGAS